MKSASLLRDLLEACSKSASNLLRKRISILEIGYLTVKSENWQHTVRCKNPVTAFLTVKS
ncbi:MAG: hypothetical protein MR303_11640 [Emergencia sp.]|nr:hypothetical protein [Emergencia sp.]